MNAAARAADHMLGAVGVKVGTTEPAQDKEETMKALVWRGKKSVKVETVPRVKVTEPKDVLLKVTATTVCGSDLHLYLGEMPDMHPGDIIGHEMMGIVEEVGSEVKNLKVGERVVVSFGIACGECEYCKREEYTGCDATNPSRLMEKMWGDKITGIFGYSHLTGGYAGGQAEYARVPFADTTCLPIPDDVPDVKALYLSDIVCTAYHGTELGSVSKGDTVGIWGMGPVGLLAARWCQVRGARRVIGIDAVPERLSLAREHLGIDVINFKEKDVVKTLQEMEPRGLDVAIETAGFRYCKSWLHAAERAVMLETDTADILTECITTVRKFGRLAIIGDYAGYANHFPIGALMEKSIRLQGGQSPTQKYWKMALEKLQTGELDPTFVVTHQVTFDEIPEAYEKMHLKREGMVKVFVRP